ncbi:hypothetical protein A79E_1794 [Klebsiella pneumoniae subsp. pneumoniae 1084]|nr:hypothetical protein A79E_1794 [Klebsiella pneumoniae subsp. pneumoniae 1084]
MHFINEQRATDFFLNHYVNAFIECSVLVLVQLAFLRLPNIIRM